MRSTTILEMKDIDKSFGPNRILHSVNFSLDVGQVHALLGANGAGKSTLVKIISGVYALDAGRVFIGGEAVSITSPIAAKNLGISIIHQELSLVPEMTVAENIYLGKERSLGASGLFFARSKAISEAKKLMQQYGISLDPGKKIRDLSIGHQQVVEILKALSDQSRILIMDEPTATLTAGETHQLFAVIRHLKSLGIGIIYISHRLDEIQEICDYVTIMKDGRVTAKGDIADFSSERIIECMVGRQVGHYFPESDRRAKETVLELKDIRKGDVLSGVSLEIRKGEIVGIFGLLGAGQTELTKVMFGAESCDSGEIFLHGSKVDINSPAKAKKLGLALVTENRKDEGLVLELGSASNMALASMGKLARYGIKRDGEIKRMGDSYVQSLNIKLNSLSEPVRNLSGGNQQKVILGKWLYTDPEVILLNEPTRGIDIGARSEIYHLLSRLADKDKGILVASSDADEILGLCDRILVLFRGRVVVEFSRNTATEELLMEYASGAKDNKAVKEVAR
ncbi:hypothetical protein SD71_19000 [Cohnella kolymensis]|uniref:ABC transporter domain-containing protein n=1 Tax=Cohnella kolymensis TaxID=1590652 RepID=A0ABR5A0H5_9BACL|nr:sugar ABC transporter ATP-binding protein [Cohnella kolymensis]KIL34559.1 hypothetical protein SD71_19000 [Cohnella kolymensis]